jgi:hypothetical protein
VVGLGRTVAAKAVFCFFKKQKGNKKKGGSFNPASRFSNKDHQKLKTTRNKKQGVKK